MTSAAGRAMIRLRVFVALPSRCPDCSHVDAMLRAVVARIFAFK